MTTAATLTATIVWSGRWGKPAGTSALREPTRTSWSRGASCRTYGWDTAS